MSSSSDYSEYDSNDSDYFCYQPPVIRGKLIKPNSPVEKFILSIADYDYKASFSWQAFFDSLVIPARITQAFLISSCISYNKPFVHLDDGSSISPSALFLSMNLLKNSDNKDTLAKQIKALEQRLASL
jgi:hypothetical protein